MNRAEQVQRLRQSAGAHERVLLSNIGKGFGVLELQATELRDMYTAAADALEQREALANE